MLHRQFIDITFQNKYISQQTFLSIRVIAEVSLALALGRLGPCLSESGFSVPAVLWPYLWPVSQAKGYVIGAMAVKAPPQTLQSRGAPTFRGRPLGDQAVAVQELFSPISPLFFFLRARPLGLPPPCAQLRSQRGWLYRHCPKGSSERLQRKNNY